MTFVKGLSTIFAGFGQPQLSPGQPSFINNTALSGTGQASTTLPATGSFSPTISAGKGRVKIYNGIGTSPTLVDILITATDGTTTVTIYVQHPNAAIALSTTAWADFEFDFITDINITSFTVKTTLGGTSPGATMDLEIIGTI